MFRTNTELSYIFHNNVTISFYTYEKCRKRHRVKWDWNIGFDLSNQLQRRNNQRRPSIGEAIERIFFFEARTTYSRSSSLKLHQHFHPNKMQRRCLIANVFLTKNLICVFQVYVTQTHSATLKFGTKSDWITHFSRIDLVLKTCYFFFRKIVQFFFGIQYNFKDMTYIYHHMKLDNCLKNWIKSR